MRPAGLLVALLLAPLALPPSSAGDVLGETLDAASASLQPHPTILIDGDAGFLDPLSGVRRGSGTEDDPYVISGWALVQTNGFALRLLGTRAHVVIEDVVARGEEAWAQLDPACLPGCTIRGAFHVEDAENVTFRRVVIASATYAFFVRDSSDVVIRDVRVGGHPLLRVTYIGVLAYGSERVHVVNGTFATAQIPFYASHSRDVSLAASRVLASSASRAVYSWHSWNVTLLDNDLPGTRFHVYEGSRGITLVGNHFRGARSGASIGAWSLEEIPGLFACGNTFDGAVNDWEGVFYVGRVQEGLIVGNRFVGNHDGLEIQLSPGPFRIERNLFQGNSGIGALIGYWAGHHVHNNSFVSNTEGSVIVGPSDARWNWWGDASGPNIAPVNGSGERLRGSELLVEPWLDAPPALDVDCLRDYSPPAPVIVPREREVRHYDGAAAVRLVTEDLGRDYHIEASYLLPSEAMKFQFLVLYDYGSGSPDYIWVSGGMGLMPVVEGNVEDVEVDVRVLDAGTVNISFGMGGYGIFPNRLDVAILFGSSSGVLSSDFALTATTNVRTAQWIATDRTGLLGIDDFAEGGERVAAQTLGQGVSYANDARVTLPIDGGFAGYARYYGLPGDSFTVEGPTVAGSASRAFIGTPPGDYVFSLTQVPGHYRSPSILWADLPT